MSSPHPLNQAVIAQALHDLRNGNLRRCQCLGFTANALEALKQPALVSMLVNAKVPWCSVRINRDVLQRLLEHGQDLDSEIKAIDRMLQLGASTDMVSEFHGLTHQEVALRREMLNMPQRKGRWPVLTEEQETGLWKQWHDQVSSLRLAPHADAAMLEVAMSLAETTGTPLSVVWSAIGDWIAQGMT